MFFIAKIRLSAGQCAKPGRCRQYSMASLETWVSLLSYILRCPIFSVKGVPDLHQSSYGYGR